FLVALPTIHTAVGLNDSSKKLIQYRFLTPMLELMLLELPHQKRVVLLLEASDKTLHLLADRN
ncbi:MAG TPA: hypothetical protein VE843_09735, partial [Ktedonobacteraceae bacterium]|nr:hypothetical protein [Ktedonobacteraceae bacterium]